MHRWKRIDAFVRLKTLLAVVHHSTVVGHVPWRISSTCVLFLAACSLFLVHVYYVIHFRIVYYITWYVNVYRVVNYWQFKFGDSEANSPNRQIKKPCKRFPLYGISCMCIRNILALYMFIWHIWVACVLLWYILALYMFYSKQWYVALLLVAMSLEGYHPHVSWS